MQDVPPMLAATLTFVALASQTQPDPSPSIVRFSAIDRSDHHPIPSGTRAPSVEGARSLDGEPSPLDLARGGWTVVNFWASWCGPCVEELPELGAASKRYEGRVRFVGLAEDDARSVKRLMERLPIPYDVALIGEVQARAWNVRALPSTFIVDGGGVVRWSIVGGIDGSVLDHALTPLLAATSTGGASPSAPLQPGEFVVGVGFAVAKDGVIVVPREVFQASAKLIAMTHDGQRRELTGVYPHEDGAEFIFVKISAAVPPLELAAGAHDPTADPKSLPLGAPLTNADGRVVGVKLGDDVTPVDQLRAAMASTKFDEETESVGPNVKRNLLISAVFYAVLIAAIIAVPGLLRRFGRTKG